MPHLRLPTSLEDGVATVREGDNYDPGAHPIEGVEALPGRAGSRGAAEARSTCAPAVGSGSDGGASAHHARQRYLSAPGTQAARPGRAAGRPRPVPPPPGHGRHDGDG